jgi:hypothetical protein
MKAILQFCLLLAIARLGLGHLVSAYYNAAAPGYFPPQSIWKFNPADTIALNNWDHLYVMRGAGEKVTGEISHNFGQRINSALSLLAKHNLLTNTVGCVDFVNPFPVMLNVAPPPGEPVWSDFHNTFNERQFIPPGEYFSNCPVVLIPAASNAHETAVALLDLYKPYLDAHYTMIDQNSSWYLLKSRSD